MNPKDAADNRIVVRDSAPTLGLLACAAAFCLMALWQAAAVYANDHSRYISPLGVVALPMLAWAVFVSVRLALMGIYVHGDTIKVRGSYRTRTFNASDVASIRLISAQSLSPVFTLSTGTEVRAPLLRTPEIITPYFKRVLPDRLRSLCDLLVSYGAEDFTGLRPSTD